MHVRIRRDRIVALRVTREERTILDLIARARGVTVSDVLRSAIKETAQRTIEHPEPRPLATADR